MRFHVLAYDESFDSAALSKVTPVADQIQTITATDYFVVPEGFNFLGAAYGLGVSITRARVVAPSLTAVAYPEIIPLDLLAEPVSRPEMLDLFDNPIELKVSETLAFEASEGGATTRVHGLLFMTEGTPEAVQGEEITIKFTNTSTLVADAWTNGALTPASDLPAGRFDIIGMRAQAAGLIAARVVLRGESSYRPGCIGFDAASDIDHPRFRHGKLGVWGSFLNTTIPTVDFLSVSADTSQEVWFDCIYTPNA